MFDEINIMQRGCGCGARWKSPLHAEQTRSIAPQNCRLLLLAQRRCREHMVHGVLLPWDRMIAAEHDLGRADLRHQVAQRFGREYKGIEIELIEIFAGFLLELDLRVTVLRRDKAG